MIYVWFIVWLLLMVFMGTGVYTLLARLTRPLVVDWLLLPGTIVSEMAYIFGCLITGGEIRRSRLLPESSGKGAQSGAPATEAQPKLRVIGPILASLIAIVACGAAILVLNSVLGQPIIEKLKLAGVESKAKPAATQRPVESVLLAPLGQRKYPTPDSFGAGIDDFWNLAHDQVSLMKHLTQSLGNLQWKDWHVPLFFYLTICLGVRLSPAGRPIRATLGAIVLIAIAIAVMGVTWDRFSTLIQDIWPLLTYVWATLLFLLVLSLLISGLVALARALGGGAAKAPKAAPKDK